MGGGAHGTYEWVPGDPGRQDPEVVAFFEGGTGPFGSLYAAMLEQNGAPLEAR